VRTGAALTGASLATTRDPGTGCLTRRIEHVGGYNVVCGSSDPEERQ
jgi:hypothetical protein